MSAEQPTSAEQPVSLERPMSAEQPVSLERPMSAEQPVSLERFLTRREDRLVAFRHRDRQMSAPEFAALVEELRAAYAELGLRPGDRVLIAMTKSIPAIAGIYAALATGVVFVPLDPDSPLPRLRHIVADADPGLVLVDAAMHERAGELLAGRTLAAFEDLGADVHRLAASSGQGAPSSAQNAASSAYGVPPEEIFRDRRNSSETAYTMYTSGSTGTPKGVCVPRSALASFLAAAVQRAGYSAETVFLNFFPLHFDPVLMEILVPWALGGQVVVMDRMRMVNDVVEQLHEAQVTDLSCPPNLISLLVGRFSSYPRRPSSTLRSIWFGGESPNVEHVRRFQEISPQVQLFNGYGPTETVIACSLYDVPDLREQGDDWEMSIGTPFRRVHFELIDDDDREIVEDDVTGELLVGGAQLMSGYRGLDPDDLEANGFVERPSGRHYRTGDLVFRRDGRYFFVGRRGGLVKLRGYRIHPAEVERALTDVAGVSAAVVLLDARLDGLRAIVEGHGVDQALLLRELEASLPSYMVPERIDVLGELPRLSSGKLDLQRIRSELVGVQA